MLVFRRMGDNDIFGSDLWPDMTPDNQAFRQATRENGGDPTAPGVLERAQEIKIKLQDEIKELIGRYQDDCRLIQATTQAEGVYVLVIDGAFGSGDSFYGRVELIPSLPELLHQRAEKMEERRLARERKPPLSFP